jgi:hypothetical protein
MLMLPLFGFRGGYVMYGRIRWLLQAQRCEGARERGTEWISGQLFYTVNQNGAENHPFAEECESQYRSVALLKQRERERAASPQFPLYFPVILGLAGSASAHSEYRTSKKRPFKLREPPNTSLGCDYWMDESMQQNTLKFRQSQLVYCGRPTLS